MRRSLRGRLLLVAIAGTVVSGATMAWAGFGPVLVKGGAGDQSQPTVNGTTLGYSANSSARPRHYDAFVEPIAGGARTKVNAPRSVGFMGHFSNDVSGQLIFQQIKAYSDVMLYDVDTGTRTQPPAGVNTRLWEWSPSMSPGFLFFGRNSFRTRTSPWKVVLFNRGTQASKVLDSVTYRCQCIWPGQVTDEYATWTKCTNACNVWYYDIVNGGAPAKVPNPEGRIQYYGGASEDSGSIYYASAGPGSTCGNDLYLMRWNPVLGGAATMVTPVTGGDIADPMYVYADGTNDDVYLSRGRCTDSFPKDIFKVEQADTATSGRIAGLASASGAGGALRLSTRAAMPRR
jgi:hypothetical protein